MQNLESGSTPEINRNETTHNEKVINLSIEINDGLESLNKLWEMVPDNDIRYLNDARKIVKGLPEKHPGVTGEFLEYIDATENKIRSLNSETPGVSKRNMDECRKELLKKVATSPDSREVSRYAEGLLSRTSKVSSDVYANREQVDLKLRSVSGRSYEKFGSEKENTEKLESLIEGKVRIDKEFLEHINNVVSQIKLSITELTEIRLTKLRQLESEPE